MLAPKISEKIKGLKSLRAKLVEKNNKVKKFKRRVFFPWYGLGAVASAVGVTLTIAGILVGGPLSVIGSYFFLGAAINNFLAITTNVVTEYQLRKYGKQIDKCNTEIASYEKESERSGQTTRQEKTANAQNEVKDTIDFEKLFAQAKLISIDREKEESSRKKLLDKLKQAKSAKQLKPEKQPKPKKRKISELQRALRQQALQLNNNAGMER